MPVGSFSTTPRENLENIKFQLEIQNCIFNKRWDIFAPNFHIHVHMTIGNAFEIRLFIAKKKCEQGRKLYNKFQFTDNLKIWRERRIDV